MRLNAEAHDEASLHLMLSQCQQAGIHRRAALLHLDRLPPSLAKPHHRRLAREAVAGLAHADRARSFHLPHGRVVIVWRGGDGAEIAGARAALEHLLAGQPDGNPSSAGELLTLYDLPDQAQCLLDEIARNHAARAPPAIGRKLELAELAGLEMRLAQTDMASLTRWRPVMQLGDASPTIAWEERTVAVDEVAESLCPGVDLRAEPWLYRRLTRILDRRMLAMLTGPRELRGTGAFALQLNTETILSPEFLRLDEALPLSLRGQIILDMDGVDILSDVASFDFARRFAQARGYRIALAGAALSLLSLLDLKRLDFDLVHLACPPVGTQATPWPQVGPRTRFVATGLDRTTQVDWAIRQGFRLGRGAALRG